jgi:hypothetical protein
VGLEAVTSSAKNYAGEQQPREQGSKEKNKFKVSNKFQYD